MTVGNAFFMIIGHGDLLSGKNPVPSNNPFITVHADAPETAVKLLSLQHSRHQTTIRSFKQTTMGGDIRLEEWEEFVDRSRCRVIVSSTSSTFQDGMSNPTWLGEPTEMHSSINSRQDWILAVSTIIIKASQESETLSPKKPLTNCTKPPFTKYGRWLI